MTSQTTLKELSKAITAFIVEPKVPLPEDLTETISAYLRRHSKYEETAADRLQEELMSIFEKHVRGKVSASAAWISILRRLLPMIQTHERILVWVESLKGILSQQPSHKKGELEEISAALTDLVNLADEYEDVGEGELPLNPVMHRLFSIWMERFYPASASGVVGMEYNERLFREALIQFGKRRPKQFFASLDSFFVQSQHRKAALRFLCEFIQSRPPHLHLILQGTMFKNLLTCLQEDTSTIVISSALTALVMLLPHMPSSIVPHLPVLFTIYARMLFWNQEKAGVTDTPFHDLENTSSWEACHHISGVDDGSISHLANYYTILYGLYPINFMDYIRKPQRYLKHANVANAYDMEIQPTELRDQSERYRKCHLIHPNFYTLTIESEKTDFERWIQSEAAEVVAQCMDLYVGTEQGIEVIQFPVTAEPRPGLFSVKSEDALDSALLRRSVSGTPLIYDHRAELRDRTGSSSTMARLDSKTSLVSDWDPVMELRVRDPISESQGLIKSASHSQLQEIMDANKVIKSQHVSTPDNNGLELTGRQSSTSDVSPGTLLPVPTPPESAQAVSELRMQVAHLQRQTLMLQNDLSFERYQKQQHIAHIGELRRKQVSEAATEAETQNLIIMNRNLKNRYEDAKKAEVQVRKESEKSRAVAKKWEADLSSKMKNLRDKYQKTNSELENVRTSLEAAKQECEKLRQLVCDGEVRELNWKQNMQMMELQANETSGLKKEMERLRHVEFDHETQEHDRQAALDKAMMAENKVEEMIMKLAAIESESQRARSILQTQVSELQSRLAEAQEDGRPPISAQRPEIQGIIESSRQRQGEMQRQYDLLIRKYTALQSSLLDMQSGATPEQIKHEVSSGPLTGSPEYMPRASVSPARSRTRPRVFSNPEGSDGTSFNVTPPLEGKHGAAGGIRPATPSGIETGSSSASPEQRYHGRGGVQNVIRTDSKGKQREDDVAAGGGGGKKEKKATGFRGLRSGMNDFVRGKTE